MVLFYASKKMEDILTDQDLIKKRYGDISGSLIIRLSELRAADNLSKIPITPPPRRHKLKGKYQNCWGINISKNYRLIVRPTNDFDIEHIDTITDIEIIAIEDYH